jgi:hypothetical protein
MTVEGAANLLDPWPLKIIFDSVIGAKAPPPWLVSNWAALPSDRLALLNTACLAILTIAAMGAVASYTRNRSRLRSLSGWRMICGRRLPPRAAALACVLRASANRRHGRAADV